MLSTIIEKVLQIGVGNQYLVINIFYSLGANSTNICPIDFEQKQMLSKLISKCKYIFYKENFSKTFRCFFLSFETYAPHKDPCCVEYGTAIRFDLIRSMLLYLIGFILTNKFLVNIANH